MAPMKNLPMCESTSLFFPICYNFNVPLKHHKSMENHEILNNVYADQSKNKTLSRFFDLPSFE